MVNHFAHEGEETDTNRIICSGFYRSSLPDVHLTITTSTPAVCLKQRYSQFRIILRPDLFLTSQCHCQHVLWHSVEGYYLFIIGIQPSGRSGQRPELSQATGMALVRGILG